MKARGKGKGLFFLGYFWGMKAAHKGSCVLNQTVVFFAEFLWSADSLARKNAYCGRVLMPPERSNSTRKGIAEVVVPLYLFNPSPGLTIFNRSYPPGIEKTND